MSTQPSQPLPDLTSTPASPAAAAPISASAVAANASKKLRIGEVQVKEGVHSEQQLKKALLAQITAGEKQYQAAAAGWFLSTTDAWVKKYYDPNDLRFVDRTLFGS